MPAGPYLPHGTTFSINGVTVGGLIGVSIPDRTRGEVETTATDSSSQRSYIPGLREGGSVQLTMRHRPDDLGQQQLETNYAAAGSAALVSCVITLPDGATSGVGSRTYTFTGFVTQPPAGDLNLVDDEAAEQTAVVKVASAVTIA